MQRVQRIIRAALLPVFVTAGCHEYDSASDDSKHHSSTNQIVVEAYQASLLNSQKYFDLPLSTNGPHIVDRLGHRVKLMSVNWYGASDAYHVVMGLDKAPLRTIVEQIKKIGFNSVRLPFSNEMLYQFDQVPSKHLSENQWLIGKTPLEVFDEVISALTEQGLLVILNNHTTTSKWCCSGDDGNGLWVNHEQSSLKWMQDWEFLIERYKQNPMLVGADLRNEVRDDHEFKANWGRGGPFDFHRVSEELGNRLLNINPDLLLVFEGLHFSTNFLGFDHTPIQLIYPNKLIFSPHLYAWSTLPNGKNFSSYENYHDFSFAVNHMLKPLMDQNDRPRAPIWFGEWGYSRKDLRSSSLFPHFMHQFLRESGFDWSWWPLNVGFKPDSDEYESWGLLDDNWQGLKRDDPRIKKIMELINGSEQSSL